MAPDQALAFAPATVGNVAVGYDILGHVMPAAGDRVRVRRGAQPGVRIAAVTGIAGGLPMAPQDNTAGRALLAMAEALALPFGLEAEIDKGIPLGSGMGGSAASAVAAVVAANALLEAPLAPLRLLQFALQGEAVASGSMHADNVAPSLYGGLVLTLGLEQPVVRRIPVPPSLRCVLVHPRIFLSTREAREILRPAVPMGDFVRQTARLAGFVAGCCTGDLDLLRAAFEDVIVEPQRAPLIPGFAAVRRAALDAGALGCSISGAGPAVFAWCEEPDAAAAQEAMREAFAGAGLDCESWVAPIDADGAAVLERG